MNGLFPISTTAIWLAITPSVDAGLIEKYGIPVAVVIGLAWWTWRQDNKRDKRDSDARKISEDKDKANREEREDQLEALRQQLSSSNAERESANKFIRDLVVNKNEKSE